MQPDLRTTAIKERFDIKHEERRRRNVEQILAQYAQGDYDTRLAMCLNYRDLRSNLAGIDERELAQHLAPRRKR